jgi:predicted nucleic acid-binding protein
VLVDTSVWIDHVRRPERRLIELLDANGVEVHPFVIGELACGQLRPRRELTALLRALRWLPTVDHEEAFALVEHRKLYGRGVGWVDIHLVASALLAATPLWTRDRRMAGIARELGLEVFDG